MTATRGLRFMLFGMLALLGLQARSAAVPESIQVGVLPHVSVRAIIANYQPLRQLFERDLGRPVEISTAPDFRAFAGRTQAGQYDLVVTAAHLARIAQLDGNYVVLGTNAAPMKGLLVMSRDQPIASAQQLRGRTLAVANPQSLVAMRGLAWLRERGLAADGDFTVVRAANEDSLGQMVAQGEAAMAMLSNIELRQIPEAVRGRLQTFAVFAEVPGFVWLAHRRLGAPDVARLRHRLMSLPATEEGRRFLEANGIEGLRELGEGELAALDPLLSHFRRLLEQAP